jgi:ribonuclease D
MIVTTGRQLQDLCDELRNAGSFGMDTEFVRERTYFIRLGILQVAASDTEAILDPQSIGSLESFFELISEPQVEKIVHAGEQDFAVLFDRIGQPPRNVFDTQIAAALVGYGEQLSYAKLVEKVTGVKLNKMETMTDWTARPLTNAQITYALEDVRHLPSLRAHLGKRLNELGREDWAKEEFSCLENQATYVPPEPLEVYERINTGRIMDHRQLGVLRELAAWREEEAMRRDIPRGWVMRDQALVEIARKSPSSSSELRRLRSVKVQELERSGNDILDAVRRGLKNPVSEDSLKIVNSRVKARAKPLVRLLEAWLHTRASSAKIAPTMLASKGQIKDLSEGYLTGQIPDLPILSGWRRELVGQDLLDILAGEIRLTVRPDTGKLKAERPPKES